jgi:branched-chain amino acid transport system ATP-binding protein
MTTGLLEARGIVFHHEGVLAVDHVDLVAEPGKVTAVIGPNGAGKTTLFDCLSGERVPSAGRVLLDGTDVTRLDTDERARRGMARTFQRSSVFLSMTVEENLLVAAENRRRRITIREFLDLPVHGEGSSTGVVQRTIDELRLGNVRNVVTGQLPTGTLRTVELARALCTSPTVLLLDEPASGLDDEETAMLAEHLATQAAAGLTVVLIEHDIALVTGSADVAYVMNRGRVLASGAPADMLNRADVRAAVLGLAS